MMRLRMTAVVLVGALALAGAALADDNDLGKKIYAQKCASCHGADGKGNAKMGAMLKVSIPALVGGPTRTDAELVKIISEGKKPMPAFANKLSKEELDAVVHFAKELATGHVAGK
jgi:mono/diheme cytochrome c family protein